MDTVALSARMDDLETRLSYQDDTIDQLNEVIRSQWARIDRLTQKTEELEQRLREVEIREGGPSITPPPHY